jgi:peptidoglycan/LPS O-acetylase OafA/YrhL
MNNAISENDILNNKSGKALYSTEIIYRPDIDGLRAWAILSVIFFHAFPEVLPGGFVGVDIFFVISGFLISKIIFQGLVRNNFSFLEFYTHRVRRIFPALIVVLLSVAIFGWFALVANEYAQLGKHGAGGVAFINNILLWREDGYFGAPSELKPLMHLWSLGVEEQFYLIFPAFVWGIWVMRVRVLSAIVLIALLSFWANVYWVKVDASGAFFLPHTRFWELLLGSVLAHREVFGSKYLNQKNKLDCVSRFNWSVAYSIVGLVFLVLAVILIDKGRGFPGYWALLPVFGSVFIILAGPDATINKLLFSNKWLVYIGLISYPLYLWHWPVLTYLRILEAQVPSVAVRVMALVFVGFISWITYEFVEKPLRFGKNRKVIVAFLCSAGILVGTGYFMIYHQNGLPSREVEKIFGDIQNQVGHKVYQEEIGGFVNCAIPGAVGNMKCSIAPTVDKPVTVAIIGDSHAADLFLGLSSHINTNVNVAYFEVVCYPFFGITSNDACAPIENVFNYVIENKQIKTVVLANYWVMRTKDKTIRLAEDPNNKDRMYIFKRLLEITVQKLTAAGKEVVFAFDVPDLNFPPEACLPSRPMAITKRLQGGDCKIARKKVEERAEKYVSSAREILVKFPEVIHWDPFNRLCNDQECLVAKDGVLLYRDMNHLSTEGGRWLAEYYSTSGVFANN